MCTQELVWCNCGHGESLPIEKCSHAAKLGTCWVVVHGNHCIILEISCSYCKTGLNKKIPLESPIPHGELAKKMGRNADLNHPRLDKENIPEVTIAEEEPDLDPQLECGYNDVLSTDFSGNFGLADDLWQWR